MGERIVGSVGLRVVGLGAPWAPGDGLRGGAGCEFRGLRVLGSVGGRIVGSVGLRITSLGVP